jgi:hypothetical protein
MLYFRSEEHIDRWCRSWRLDRGAVLTLEQGWRLAVAWFSADRRAPEWRRRTVDEVEQVFGEIGLISPFWNLR